VQDAVYRDTVAVLAGTDGHVTPDALQRLHYVRACVKETLRLRANAAIFVVGVLLFALVSR